MTVRFFFLSQALVSSTPSHWPVCLLALAFLSLSPDHRGQAPGQSGRSSAAALVIQDLGCHPTRPGRMVFILSVSSLATPPVPTPSLSSECLLSLFPLGCCWPPVLLRLLVFKQLQFAPLLFHAPVLCPCSITRLISP